MAKVLEWPNEILTKIATPVPEGESCRRLIESMFKTMNRLDGIGLAAPQIGVDKRIFVMDVPAFRNGIQVSGSTKHAIINPIITWWRGGPEMGPEGCLSFPGESVIIPRYLRVKIVGFDIRWNPLTVGGKGLVARVIQHEMDHLNGRTLMHYATLAKEAFAELDERSDDS